MCTPGEGPVRIADVEADIHGLNPAGGERRAGLAVALTPSGDAETGTTERERCELDFPLIRPPVGQRKAKQFLIERPRRGNIGDREDGKRRAEARLPLCSLAGDAGGKLPDESPDRRQHGRMSLLAAGMPSAGRDPGPAAASPPSL